MEATLPAAFAVEQISDDGSKIARPAASELATVDVGLLPIVKLLVFALDETWTSASEPVEVILGVGSATLIASDFIL